MRPVKLTGSAKTQKDRDEVHVRGKWIDGQNHQQEQFSSGSNHFSSVASSDQRVPLDQEDRSASVKQSCLPLAAGDSMQMLKPRDEFLGLGCQYQDKADESCLFFERQSS